MASNKYVALGFVFVFGAAIVFGGFELWTHRSKNNLNYGLGSFQAGQSDSGYNNGNNIPLNQASSSGLNADSGPNSGNLGQLSAGSGGSSGASSTEQGIPSSSSSSSSSNSSGSSGCNTKLDTSTFSSYNQYLNNDKPLFGTICSGNGSAVTSTSNVSVAYIGWLTDGTMFDESHTDSGGQMQPFTFTEGKNQVISGWEDGLLGLKAGGVYVLIIPPKFGYGPNGNPPSIPGNSVLVFEVQIISVN